MRYGYDYPELFKKDQIARRWRYELRKLRAAVRSARQTVAQASGAFLNIARILKPARQAGARFQRRDHSRIISSSRPV